MKARFYSNCVGWPRNDVRAEGGLCDMIDANKLISRQTFLRHVHREDQRELEQQLGYEREGLVMSKDWAVSYHKSKLHGRTVYYFQHSAIEYVFRFPEQTISLPALRSRPGLVAGLERSGGDQ